MRNVLRVCFVSAASLLLLWSAPARAASSIAGVHWYSGSCFQANASIPAGERGWNVETVIGSNDQGWINESLAGAQAAAGAGLRNIIRIDYRQNVPVPKSSVSYAGWASEFWSVANQFKNQNLATVFIVGNEPNVESCTSAAQYAGAFSYLFSHASRPAGIQLLAAGPATYSPNPTGVQNPDGSCVWTGGDFRTWLNAMQNGLTNTDGFALHTYGGPYEGRPANPSQACSRNGWAFDAGFQSYKQQIAQITKAGFTTKPIHLTEFNTDVQPRTAPEPRDAYPANWINLAFQDVRNYNAANSNRIQSLVWFVDRNAGGGWPDFSLINIPAACQDMKEEFANAANRPGTVVSGNSAVIVEGTSSVPTFLMPGEIRRVTIQAQNNGSTTWTTTAPCRLGAAPDNSLVFSSFPQCGGYSLAPGNARVYLCSNVAPGSTASIQLDARAPVTGNTATLSVQMVQESVAFFGENQKWGVHVGTTNCGTACSQCILDARTDVLPFYASNGWSTSCGNRDAIVANWCAGVDPSACNNLKSGQCGAFCNACRCSFGKHTDGTAIDPNGTFCGFKVCGMDKQIYRCDSNNAWTGLGTPCQ